jgi:hypothetical protein
MPTVQSPELLDVLKRTAAALHAADVDFALAGGLAAWAHGGPATEHDIDLVITAEDAETALAALHAAGFRVDHPPEGWLVKAWYDDVLIDLIVDPKGIDVDAAFIARCETLSVSAVEMKVVPLEDLLVSKLLALTEHHLDFGPPLEWARSIREQVDWDEVSARTQQSPFARTFVTMLVELDVIARPRAVNVRSVHG